MQTLRVVCYLNQFFGQLGGEDKAGVGPQVMPGAIGSARAVQQALGDIGTVVATVLCGDNYVAEQPDTAVAELLPLVAAQRATAMPLAKLAGQPLISEVPLPDFPQVQAPPPVKELRHATMRSSLTVDSSPRAIPIGSKLWPPRVTVPTASRGASDLTQGSMTTSIGATIPPM